MSKDFFLAKMVLLTLLFMLLTSLVLSVIDYGLGLVTISKTQLQKLERIQNEAMRTVLGCTRDTSCAAMRYLLGLTSIEERHRLAQVRALFRIAQDKDHPLYSEIGTIKGSRIKRGKSWLAEAEDHIRGE